MKRKLYSISILIFTAFVLTGQEIVNTTFSSNSLNGETIPLNIYLPQDYNENGVPYHLYVFLHGCCGLNHQTHIGDFETRLNQLIGDGSIEPLIVVFPSAQGANFGNRHMWFNSERNGPYSDLITADLLNWITSNYNVSSIKRAIGGFSMGADGALRIGLHDSDKFVAAIGHSSFPAMDFFPNLIPILINETGQSSPPYLFTPTPGTLTETVYGASSAWSPNNDNPNHNLDFPVDENGVLIDSVFIRWKVNADIDSIIRFNWGVSKEVPISIYFDVGAGEGFYPPNALLNAQLTSLIQSENYQINYKYLEFPGGHVLTSSKIDSSLIWLNEVFSNVTTLNHEINEVVKDLSVYPNPANESIIIEFSGKTNKEYLIRILDMNGKTIQENFINSSNFNKLNLDISDYKSGVYLTVIIDKTTGKVITNKLIKI
jgi:enterochelin esterase-like enzyme